MNIIVQVRARVICTSARSALDEFDLHLSQLTQLLVPLAPVALHFMAYSRTTGLARVPFQSKAPCARTGGVERARAARAPLPDQIRRRFIRKVIPESRTILAEASPKSTGWLVAKDRS